jgi:hypothetical protein
MLLSFEQLCSHLPEQRDSFRDRVQSVPEILVLRFDELRRKH